MPAGKTVPQKVQEIADHDEVLALLTAAARKGHVGAMRLLLEEMRHDAAGRGGAQPEGVLDELTAKRKKASGIR